MARAILLRFKLLLLLPTALQAQSVGLVLSGGGSSGLAHVGVIRALEENGVPIDYVAGTSMGAVVAAMYAVGMSPSEMEDVVLSKRFFEMAKGIISEEFKYYFKMPDPDPSWVNLRFEIDSGIRTRLPVNIVSPYAMDIGLIEFMSAAIAAAGYDFDRLFVPFRCVAADVAAKREVVFRRGDICQAVRASFTYPLYMKPISVDGRLLFDGGIYNNFPSDVMASDFAPDIIIGSVVASELTDPRQDDIASQLKALLMHHTDYSAVCENGILIHPVIPDIPVMDFSRNGTLVKGGYETTLAMMPEIKASVTRVVDASEKAEERRRFNASKPELRFGKVTVSGLKDDQADYVQRSIRQRDEAVDFRQVRRAYFKLAEDEMIKSIYPIARYDSSTGLFDLHLDIRRENDILAQFGGNISSRSINQAYIGLGYRFFRQFGLGVHLNTHIGKFYTSGQLRARIDFPTRVPFFLEFIAIGSQWNYFDSFATFFEATKPSYLVQNERFTELRAGLPLTSKIKLMPAIGFTNINNSYYHTSNFEPDDIADESTINVLTMRLMAERRTFNRKMYPTEGREFVAQVRFSTGREVNQPGTTSLTEEVFEESRQWVSALIRYSQYFFTESDLRLGVFGEAAYSSQDFFANYQTTLLMATPFEPTPESRTLFLDQYRNNRYASVGLRTVWLAWKNLDVRLEAYLYHPWEKYIRNDNQEAEFLPVQFDPHLMANGAVVYHTPLGPVSLSANYYQKQDRPWSFLFHIGYILFNRRGLE